MNVPSCTLESIIKNNNIKKIKLLKIDCEGSEYEILYSLPTEVLNNIDIMRGEFHENKNLSQEYDIDKLLLFCEKHVDDIKIEKCSQSFIM